MQSTTEPFRIVHKGYIVTDHTVWGLLTKTAKIDRGDVLGFKADKSKGGKRRVNS